MKKENIPKNISILSFVIIFLTSTFFLIVEIFKRFKFYLINGYFNNKYSSILDIIGQTQYIGFNNIIKNIPVILILVLISFFSFKYLVLIKEDKNKTTKEEALYFFIFSVFVLFIIFNVNTLIKNKWKNSVNSNNNVISEDKKDTSLNNEKAKTIVASLYLKNPEFALYQKFNQENFIFSCVDSKYLLLKEFANTWQTVYKNEQNCNTELEENYDMYNNDNDLFIYFVILNQGSAFGTAYFNIYSYKDDKVYTIEAFGPHGSYNDFTIPNELNQKPDVLNYLQNKISESKYIFHQSQKILDENSPKNAVRNWQINNNIPKIKNYNKDLKIKKFKSIKIEDFFDEKISKEYIESSKWEFKNDNYLIISYFKGAIFCLDKNTDEHFVLFVPEDAYDWVEKIEFKDENTIVIYNKTNNNKEYEINIKNLTIMKY